MWGVEDTSPCHDDVNMGRCRAKEGKRECGRWELAADVDVDVDVQFDWEAAKDDIGKGGKYDMDMTGEGGKRGMGLENVTLRRGI